ncbi:MAG: protein-L-isoaspartate O-methyltransferase [Variibacter sp.]|nr:protein-L-isoaspartate O-methyltransferase [Variibacter sp.]
MTSFDLARRMMVDGQIRTSDVTDGRIIAAFAAVPRERFVPPAQAALAYLDRDVPAGGAQGRSILKPMVLAKMIQAADIDSEDRVLDVGCASGYSTAILSHLAKEVIGLEEDAALAAQARELLAGMGRANATVREGALAAGAAGDAPFDVILVNGAVETLPAALGAQLKDGGRLICLERKGGTCRAMLYFADRGDLSGRSLFDASAPVLPGFVAPPAFVF